MLLIVVQQTQIKVSISVIKWEKRLSVTNSNILTKCYRHRQGESGKQQHYFSHTVIIYGNNTINQHIKLYKSSLPSPPKFYVVHIKEMHHVLKVLLLMVLKTFCGERACSIHVIILCNQIH